MGESNYASFSPYVTGAGYATQAFADIAQGILASKRAKAISDYNARIVEENSRAAATAAEIEALQQERAAALAEQDMLLAEQAGTYREARMREQHEALLSQTRAIIASSGLLMRGSPLRVYEETARQQERDILASRYQTTLQQRALRTEATQARYGAALSRYGAGERLRVGKQQAALTRALRDDSQVLAGVTRAGSSLLAGTAATMAQREQLKNTRGPTVREPFAFTRATTAEQPYVYWNR